MRGAARVPVLGRARVANLATAHPRFWGEVEVRPVQANGRSGVLLHRNGSPSTFMTIAAFLDSRSRYTTAPGIRRYHRVTAVPITSGLHQPSG